MDENEERKMMGAHMLARRHVSMAMTRQGMQPAEGAPTYMPTAAAQHAPRPAPVATAAPAPKPEPAPKVNPWRRVVDSYNGKTGEDKPKSSAWSAAVARINERLKSC